MELANNCNRAEYTHNISIIGEHNCSKTVFDYLAKQGNESERSSTQFVPADDYYLHPCTISFETTEFHYSINLINTPGHSEFIDEAIAALWITDGAIVVVDCQVGITQHTIDVVQKAVAEHVKLLLLFDNVESWLNQPTEEVLDVLHSNLWKINSRVPLVHDRFALGSKNVLFGSTEHKWIISPFQLARSFKTSSAHADGTLETCVRGLCEILEACKSSSPAERLSEQLTIVPGGRFAEDQRDSVLFHSVMQTLSSIGAVYEAMVKHLPSATQAQKYRAFHRCGGLYTDDTLAAMLSCNPAGPSVLFVSKIIWGKRGTTADIEPIAIGRLFSGTIRTGEPLWIIEANRTPDKRAKCVIQKMYNISETTKELSECTCGSIVMIPGFTLNVSATLSSIATLSALAAVKSNGVVLIEYAIECAAAVDLIRLAQAMKSFSKLDIAVRVYANEYGNCIGAVGAKHAEVLLERFKRISEIQVIVGQQMKYRESVSEPSVSCLAKSPNKHNRVWTSAIPMDPTLLQILSSQDWQNENVHETMQTLNDQHLFVNEEYVALDGSPINIYTINKAIRTREEWIDSFHTASLFSTSEGVLCGEQVLGITFAVDDVHLTSDRLRRGAGQLIPTFRRSLYAAHLLAKPVLLEAILLVEVLALDAPSLYQMLSVRRAVILDEEYIKHSDAYMIRCHLPASESLDMHSRVVSCRFSHWQQVPGDPLEEGSFANKTLLRVRKSKGMKEAIPELDMYLDKL